MERKEINITREEFNTWYHIDNLSEKEIADKLNVSISVIKRLRKEFNIDPKTKEEIAQMRFRSNLASGKWEDHSLSRDDLEKLYIIENKSATEICNLCNIDSDSLKYLINKYNLIKSSESKRESRIQYKRDQTGDQKWGTHSVTKTDIHRHVIVDEYGNKHLDTFNAETFTFDYLNTYMTYKELAKKYNVSVSTIKTWKKQLGIKRSKEHKFETYSRSILSDVAVPILKDKNALQKFLNDNAHESITTLSKKLDISTTTLYRYLAQYDMREQISAYDSTGENSLQQFLLSLGVNSYKTRTLLAPLEIDLYCPDYNIGIEYNGDYWHSDVFKNKNYHFKKVENCDKQNIHLIHIYEHEWNDPRIRPILESLLKIAFGKISSKIYARNCEVRKITNKEAKPFNDANHLQGHRNAQLTYGLFYEDKLVQLMSFTYDKKHGWWEIIRGCPGSNNIVIGGVSKLFTHFIRENNPDKVFSYCDYNKFNGHGYEALGMEFIGYTGPDLMWLMPDGQVIHRCPSKHKELSETAVAKIWGAGSKKYLWTNVNNKV